MTSSRRRRLPRIALLVALALGAAGVGVVADAGPVAAVGSTGPWSWPTDPPHRVVTPYRAPASPWAPGHRGIDIAAAPGSAVRAPAEGVVHFAGVVVDRPVLSIRHDGGLISSYEPVVASVARGDEVMRGQPIGEVQAGHCEGDACVHFGVRLDGEYVSPLLLLGGLERAVLLPVRR
jgi:murein DD-endopeptidase MepM/ murein hydrolase activator NlpD